MKSGKKTSRTRRKGAFLVELLVAIGIGGMIIANSSVRLETTLTQARWAEANILQQNLQNTYEKWVSLGGTHAAPPISPSNPFVSVFDGLQPDDITIFTVNSAVPNGNTVSVNYTLTTTAQPRVSGQFFVYYINTANNPTPGGNVGFVSNDSASIIAPSQQRTISFLPNTRLSLYTFDMSNGSTIAAEPLFTFPQVNVNQGAELTNALWNTFLTGTTPVATGGGTAVTDSTRSGVNSTAIRLSGSFPNAPVIDAEDSILLEGMYRIRFEPTATNRGIWTVIYDG